MAIGIILALVLAAVIYAIRTRSTATKAEMEYVKENGFGINGDSTPGDDFTR